jgi:hypothetical protein
MATDWLAIRNEYINGNMGQRKLAEKYGISYGSLRARAEKEKWPELRKKQQRKISAKTAQKTAEQIAQQEAKRAARIHAASDELLLRIEQAIRELDQAQVSHKKKTKTVEYKDKRAAGKPTKEVTTEVEDLITVPSIIDRKGLQQIATALKAVWDIAEGESSEEEVEDDGLLAALGANAKALMETGDDSELLPQEEEE